MVFTCNQTVQFTFRQLREFCPPVSNQFQGSHQNCGCRPRSSPENVSDSIIQCCFISLTLGRMGGLSWRQWTSCQSTERKYLQMQSVGFFNFCCVSWYLLSLNNIKEGFHDDNIYCITARPTLTLNFGPTNYKADQTLASSYVAETGGRARVGPAPTNRQRRSPE